VIILYQIDFDDSDCALISKSMENLSETICDEMDNNENMQDILSECAMYYNDELVELDWLVAYNQRDEFSKREVELMCNSLKEYGSRDALELRNKILDLCGLAQ
jgi:hypothetical protein